MKKIVFVCCLATALVACVENSAKYKNLERENELLKIEKEKSATELDEMLATLNDIQADIQTIREAENYLSIAPSAEVNNDQKEQLRNNMRMIAETLQANKKQIADLQEKLQKSNIQSKSLQQTINRISEELNQKTEMIARLQEDLSRKDIRIKELDHAVASLSKNVDSLAETNASQAKELAEKELKLNTAYYCFGTKKELKEQNILTGGGLFSKTKVMEAPFNESYFISVDIRKFTELQLFAHKATIRSNHPEGSYRFVKDSKGNMTLQITDIQQFWSLGRYLVIEVG